MSIEVTQADREAAHEWMRGQSSGLRMMMVKPRGLYETFACHRQQAVAAEVAQIVAWLRGNFGSWNVEATNAKKFAGAIERGEYKETAGE